jgi:hypothetical protein
MRDVGRYIVAASPVFDAAAASPDFDVVAALPALMECTADFCRVSSLRPPRPGKFVTPADAAGLFTWLPWAQFVSPCNSAWTQGLACQAGGAGIQVKLSLAKGCVFGIGFLSSAIRDP